MPPRAQPLLLAAVAAHAAATQGHAGQRAQAAANPWRWVLRRAPAGAPAGAERGVRGRAAWQRGRLGQTGQLAAPGEAHSLAHEATAWPDGSGNLWRVRMRTPN